MDGRCRGAEDGGGLVSDWRLSPGAQPPRLHVLHPDKPSRRPQHRWQGPFVARREEDPQSAARATSLQAARRLLYVTHPRAPHLSRIRRAEHRLAGGGHRPRGTMRARRHPRRDGRHRDGRDHRLPVVATAPGGGGRRPLRGTPRSKYRGGQLETLAAVAPRQRARQIDAPCLRATPLR